MESAQWVQIAGCAGAAFVAFATPVWMLVAKIQKDRAAAMREAERPVAPAALPVASATDATRVVQLESELERMKWTLELCEKALENERRETQELSAALTAERTAATQERLLHLHERLVDSGLTPLDSPPTRPRGKRPQRRSE